MRAKLYILTTIVLAIAFMVDYFVGNTHDMIFHGFLVVFLITMEDEY
jgi:hypothetical protein